MARYTGGTNRFGNTVSMAVPDRNVSTAAPTVQQQIQEQCRKRTAQVRVHRIHCQTEYHQV